MTKKEMKISLNKSDDSYIVELEPLRSSEDEADNLSPWKRQNNYQSGESPNSSTLSEPCEEPNCGTRLGMFFKENKKAIKLVLLVLLLLGFIGYFAVACYLDFKRARDLVIVTSVTVFFFIYAGLKHLCGSWVYKNCYVTMSELIDQKWKILRWVVYLGLLSLIGLWIGFDTVKDLKRLISAFGFLMYIALCYLASKHRTRIRWRPVLWGIGIQFCLGLLILRTKPGYFVFRWLGDRAGIFLSFSDAGAHFIFGKNLLAHPFAFKVLPVVVFFSSFIYMVYYLGIMQAVIKRIAWLMQCTLGTSAAESLNTAGNIFIGQTEAPLLIRPFLPDLTMSELHAVMTSGFATIAGSVLGAYISFGVPATHLLSASFMNAPAALAVSKLIYPETETPKSRTVDEIKIEKGKEKNIVEALAAGASMSISLVANIAVNLIAFVAVLAFIDGILQWLGSLVGLPNLTFGLISAYVCMPFAYLMGVEWQDAFKVGQLLGTKTFINEFVAYKQLSKLISNRKLDLDGPAISIRSETIATYALCGFANISSIGIQIGGISALAPSRTSDLAKIAFRALVSGTIACFMTACIAGILYEESLEVASVVASSNTAAALLNSTIQPNTTVFSSLYSTTTQSVITAFNSTGLL
eukprot:gene22-612_t